MKGMTKIGHLARAARGKVLLGAGMVFCAGGPALAAPVTSISYAYSDDAFTVSSGRMTDFAGMIGRMRYNL